VSDNAAAAPDATVEPGGGIVMKSHLFGFALLSTIGIVASAPAHAQNGSLTRSFVSSAGLDTNSCMITAPCATFAVAYTKIAANGIIAALDPGKYGPLTGTSAITGPVTVNGNGWAAITAPANGFAITIAAGFGNVILNGLEIDGAGSGWDGIVFNSGSSLTVTNCTLQNFVSDPSSGLNTGYGIVLEPGAGTFNFSISNTSASNSQEAGIAFLPSNGANANIIIDGVVTTGSSEGIYINPPQAGSGSAIVSISNIVASGNSVGVYVFAGSNFPAEVLISNGHVDNNSEQGLVVVSNNGDATAVLKNVTINQTPSPIFMAGYATIYLSQVTTVIAPGFPSNGGITSTGSNNAVFSDGTSHLGSSNPVPQSWSMQ
jgi:hypothetical protein